MALTVGSLFSGIGGIDLGLERAGMESRWFVEWDAHCQNVLRRHWPGLPVYGDITVVDWSIVEPVDVLAGGFPCQPVSNAGKRLGTDDERWLWPAFAGAIRALRPRYVLVENVAALLGRGFEHVITDLAALGYDAEWDCIPAAAVGAPHLRDRLWIVAHTQRSGTEPVRGPGGLPRAARGAEGAPPQRERRGDAVGDRCETLANAARDGRTRRGTRNSRRDADPSGSRDEPTGGGAGERARALPDTDASRRRTPVRADDARQSDAAGRSSDVANPARERGGALRTEGVEPRRTDGDRGGGERDVPNAVFAGLEGHERGVAALAEYRRSNADPAGSGWWSAEPDLGRVADGVPHRVDRLRSLGNAVVPQVVEWIGRRIVAFDEGRLT